MALGITEQLPVTAAALHLEANNVAERIQSLNRNRRQGPARAWAGAALVSAVALLSATVATGAELGFLDDAVEVTGMTPGSQAVLFSVARERQAWLERVVPRIALLAPSSRDEPTRLQLDTELAPKSVWALVDLSSGQVVVDSPAEGAYRQVESTHALADQETRPLVDPDTGWLQRSGHRLHLLVVRPGVGAWSGRAADGASADRDGHSDGKLSIDVQQLQAVQAGRSALEALQAGDVVVGIDPNTLEIFSHQVSNETAQAAER